MLKMHVFQRSMNTVVNRWNNHHDPLYMNPYGTTVLRSLGMTRDVVCTRDVVYFFLWFEQEYFYGYRTVTCDEHAEHAAYGTN